ncbi:MAG: Mur ligase family protein [Bacteroidota bacterium]
MKVHFIAIGGSAMHNLAIALHNKGYIVSGSDDEIFEPSRTRLEKLGLLPAELGWFPDKINSDLDAVILGMHAHADNPELLKAVEAGIQVFSYPEFLYQQSKNKKRIVIGGSHGKTSITSMILHVLAHYHVACDYMVGAQLEGFDVMVKLTEDAPFMILEGDEYLTSPIDRRPKFHLYMPDIALISGIAWDHINVFPTFENYKEQFRIFAEQLPNDGCLIYNNADKNVAEIAIEAKGEFRKIPYSLPEYSMKDGITFINYQNQEYEIQVFGQHNLLNINGAALVCEEMGITKPQFYEALKSFKGASKRLEKIFDNKNVSIFRDFAHAPSKLQASINAVKEQYPNRKLIACFELHTYSSLNSSYLKEYKSCMDNADVAVVYFNPHTLALKRLPMLEKSQILEAFNNPNLKTFDNKDDMLQFILTFAANEQNLLLMSSGNFDGMDVENIKNTYLLLNNVKV